MNWKRKTDKEILLELGKRIRAKRIQKRFKQSVLAHHAGISLYTLRKMEHGQSFNVSTLIQVLRALNELDHLESFLPEVGISPIDMLGLKDKTRKRVRNPNKDGSS
jgi:transcriptional regulator with XRE-family HTH domain